MGHDNVSHTCITCAHVLAMNASLNASDIAIYIPINKSEYSLYEHTPRHGHAMTMILIISSSAYFPN